MEQADEGAPFRFDLGLWREFVQAMERHRLISCSRCLLAEFGLVEEDDDTVAARDGEIVPVLHIEADATRGLIRAHAVPDLIGAGPG